MKPWKSNVKLTIPHSGIDTLLAPNNLFGDLFGSGKMSIPMDFTQLLDTQHWLAPVSKSAVQWEELTLTRIMAV